MDELAIQIANEARKQIEAATTPQKREQLIAQAAADLRAKLKGGNGR